MYIPTVRMVRLDKYISIRDIVHWEINIPKSDVSFLYTRKSDGFAYFRCSDHYDYNRRVFMSSDELLCVCQHAEEWVNEHFKSHSVLTVSYTHLRAHETPEHLVCRLLLEKKKKKNEKKKLNDKN